MSDTYIIALDQGTTSCRAILFDEKSQVVGVKQREFTQFFPRAGWVEHDPEEIWRTQLEVLRMLLIDFNLSPIDINALGITNQRETTILWDRNTGDPVYQALVWQDKRTSDYCDALKEAGHEAMIKEKTGLVIDSYFSATKIKWILDNVKGVRDEAESGNICFGTIDSWLIWNLSKGKVHATDFTNASRTLLYNINGQRWDEELLELFDIPAAILPEVHPSSYHFGDFEFKGVTIPVMGVAGDQQAALFGQACFEPGEAKNTYGTGCFLLMNTGNKTLESKHGLLTTMACSSEGEEAEYALEGSIFIAGAAIQWLRDGLRLLDEAFDSEYFASKADTYEVFMVPAFAGLGAPYWDQHARGAIFGLTRDTNKNHIIKAALESIAFQTRDVKEAMEADSDMKITTLNVDGGATINNYLMQFQADILGLPVDRPFITESTALGAAYLAGLRSGLWTKEQIRKLRKTEKTFQPNIPSNKREQLYKKWKNAVERTFNWDKE